MNIYYTYKLVHIKTGQFYYGSRRSRTENPYKDLGVKYFSSGCEIRRLGFEHFMYGIVQTYEAADRCYWDEQALIKEHIKNPLCLNRHYQNPKTKKMWSMLGIPKSEETRKKMSLAHLGKRFTKKHRRNMSLARAGLKASEATRKRISDGLKMKYATGWTPKGQKAPTSAP